jgi:hypothetical protein
MKINDAVRQACQEPTLLDALDFIAIWESEHIVKQAKAYFETGVSTASHEGGWDTCFRVCFKQVLVRWFEEKG